MLAMGREDDPLYMTHEANAASWMTRDAFGITKYITVAADYGTGIVVVDVTIQVGDEQTLLTHVLAGIPKEDVVEVLLAGGTFEEIHFLKYEQAHHYGH